MTKKEQAGPHHTHRRTPQRADFLLQEELLPRSVRGALRLCLLQCLHLMQIQMQMQTGVRR